MAVTHTRALILRHRTEREHDRVLDVLTPHYGKLHVRARGTKKSTSKLGGSLEPLTEVDLSFAHGRALNLVTGSILRHRFAPLRKDVVAFVSAQWLLELTDQISKEGAPTEAIYQFVVDALHAMEDEMSLALGQRWLVLWRRAWMLLRMEGFAPSTEECSICHDPLRDDHIRYDPVRGFFHGSHEPGHGRAVSAALLQYLRGGEVATAASLFREAQPVIESTIHHAIDRPLRSESVLRSTMRLGQLPKGQ